MSSTDTRWDRRLEASGKAFLYLPFMHSENLDDQDRSITLYQTVGLKENMRHTRHHHKIIHRFGCFARRNPALGRDNTREKLAWLQSKEVFSG